MINLNKWFNQTGTNYLLISATAINDKGQIVASAWDIFTTAVYMPLC